MLGAVPSEAMSVVNRNREHLAFDWADGIVIVADARTMLLFTGKKSCFVGIKSLPSKLSYIVFCLS